MKRILSTAILLFTALSGFNQVMQASMGIGSSSTRVKLYVKPTAAVNGTISTLQFSVAIDAAITPVPLVAVVGATAFGVTWNIDPSYVEGGYRIFDFTTAASPAVTIAANTETPVMEIEFSGGQTSANNVLLLTLPGGGNTTGNTLFLCSGAATSVEGQLYYTRAGTTVVNNSSYTGPLNSTVTLGGVVLPVNWLSFDVIKQGNDGLLNWTVANEESNHHYELQRSTNAISFTTIATVNKSGAGNTAYHYTDAGINTLNTGILYYRIKQVDINGRISYSDIRTLRLDNKEGQVTIFPNPVKDGFYISVPFAGPGNSMVKLNLVSVNGQLICAKEITASQATNYYFDIKRQVPAAGNYNLQIIVDQQLVATKKLYISK